MYVHRQSYCGCPVAGKKQKASRAGSRRRKHSLVFPDCAELVKRPVSANTAAVSLYRKTNWQPFFNKLEQNWSKNGAIVKSLKDNNNDIGIIGENV